MFTPKEIQDEQYWKDTWDFTIKYQNFNKGKKMYTFIVGESQPEFMQGTWHVTETIAGDADKVLVNATKDGVNKKMWVKRTELVSTENEVDVVPGNDDIEENAT